MAACRETDHPDPLRADTPLRGFAPHQADGPLGILQRTPGRLALGSSCRRGTRYLRMMPVTPSEFSHAGDFLAFQLPVEVPIAAPGQISTAVPVSFSFAGR